MSGDWKTVEDALDMWGATQVAIRGHVRLVSEAVGRLHKLSDGALLAAQEAEEVGDERLRRIQELKDELRKIESLYPRGEPAFEIAHSALGT